MEDSQIVGLYWERNEFSATMLHGENIFEDPIGYTRWKEVFEQLLNNTQKQRKR